MLTSSTSWSLISGSLTDFFDSWVKFFNPQTKICLLHLSFGTKVLICEPFFFLLLFCVVLSLKLFTLETPSIKCLLSQIDDALLPSGALRGAPIFHLQTGMMLTA